MRYILFFRVLKQYKFQLIKYENYFSFKKISEEIVISDSIEQSKFKIMVSIEGYMENLSTVFNLIRV